MNQKKRTSLNPYLNFNGDCREAMEFYASALDADLQITPFRGSPSERQVTDEYLDKVLHATLRYEDILIMASDTIPEVPVTNGSNTALYIAAVSLEEARSLFGKLSAGGTILMPFERTFWGADFGMCTDRFGIQWMVSFESPTETQDIP